MRTVASLNLELATSLEVETACDEVVQGGGWTLEVATPLGKAEVIGLCAHPTTSLSLDVQQRAQASYNGTVTV